MTLPGDAFELRRGDADYPSSLEDLPYPPPVIYGRGDPKALSEEAISVIGARRATPYGLSNSEIAGRLTAESGLVLVSGGAMGCDSAAARAALAAGGRTVVVAGCGADIVYPRSSKDVFEGAARRGAVISLEKWGFPPERYTFPKRNKVIAALSRATFVAEAARHSGTMSTAETAVELGRELYAIPGSIFSPTSVGTNDLIANGARIICSEKDLEACISLDFERLRLTGGRVPTVSGRVISALIASPMRADDLATRMGEGVLDTLKALSDYESRGIVVRLPDGRYSPSAQFLGSLDRMGGS